MSAPQRVLSSPYMEFAKTKQSAKYNLAISGMIGYPFSELPVTLSDLQINPPAGYGYSPLLEAVAKKCGVKSENVVTTLGTSMANYLVLTELLNPGDEVIFEAPVYELMVAAAGSLSASIKYFHRRPEDGFCIDPSIVASVVTPKTKLIVLTNLHNPSSAYVDEGTLQQIGKLAQAVGAYVLVDEVYLDAMFEDAPKTAFNLGDNFIITNSLTKVYGLSGFRCGWIIAEPELTRKIWRLIDIMYGVQAHPTEILSIVAVQNLAKIAQRSKQILEANHRTLDQFLDGRDDLFLVPQKYGTVVFPKLLHGDVDDLANLLRSKYETTIVPGRFFGMPEYFRIGLCGEPVMVEGGFSRLAAALNEMR